MKKNWLHSHFAAACAFGVMLLLTPFNNAKAQAIKWNSKALFPSTGTSPAGSNAMCFAIGSKIYVGGGYIASFTNSKEFYEYDTTTNVWTKRADLPGALNRSSGVAFAINGKGYIGLGAENFLDVSGGAVLKNDLWEYNPTGDSWTPRAALPDTGRTYAACFVLNNKAYIIGGQVTNGGFTTADVWEYEPVGNAWTARAPHPLGTIQGPFAFSLSTSAGVRGYTSCGSISGGNTKKTYEYNATANSWTPKSDYPGSAIRGGVSLVINNKAYCGMGMMSFTAYTDTFYTYNPTAGSWGAAITTYPGDPCAFPVAASLGNKAYMGAGWTYAGGGSETFNTNWFRVIDTAVVTGIDEVNTGNTISLFPNPATNELNIAIGDDNSSNGELAIVDMAGKLCLATQWQTGKAKNIAALPAGNYIVRLTTVTGAYYSRLAVQPKQ